MLKGSVRFAKKCKRNHIFKFVQLCVKVIKRKIIPTALFHNNVKQKKKKYIGDETNTIFTIHYISR